MISLISIYSILIPNSWLTIVNNVEDVCQFTYHEKNAKNIVRSCEDSHTSDLWAVRIIGIEMLTCFVYYKLSVWRDPARLMKVTQISLQAKPTKQTLNSIFENWLNHLGFFSSISAIALLHTSCSSAITDDYFNTKSGKFPRRKMNVKASTTVHWVVLYELNQKFLVHDRLQERTMTPPYHSSVKQDFNQSALQDFSHF